MRRLAEVYKPETRGLLELARDPDQPYASRPPSPTRTWPGGPAFAPFKSTSVQPVRSAPYMQPSSVSCARGCQQGCRSPLPHCSVGARPAPAAAIGWPACRSMSPCRCSFVSTAAPGLPGTRADKEGNSLTQRKCQFRLRNTTAQFLLRVANAVDGAMEEHLLIE